MQDVQFFDSKSGDKTCSINSIRLHSSYDPVKEAQRYVSSLDINFVPSLIVVTEPALSYCACFLRKRFPKTILVAIRFSNLFDDYNSLWDKVFYYDEVDSLLNIYGEDLLLVTGFFSWQPAQQVFPDEYISCWNKIRTLLQTGRDILATRAYFAKRWLKNTLLFCFRLSSASLIKNGTSPVLLVASGPSLESSIEHIKKHRKSIFIIALSSALPPLLDRKITPDLCISTDGGYWAKKHIEKCPVPIALPAEAAVPSTLFNQTIIPLEYGDGPEANLLKFCRIPFMKALRNGTVSGTALEFALSITSGPVFACGLDLSSTVGFQHCQPNSIEINNENKDFRLITKETRLFPQELPSHSLEIYAQWFASQSKRFKDRFYRLSHCNYKFSNTLGEIKDINWNDFEKILQEYNKNHNDFSFPSLVEKKLQRKEERYTILLNTLTKYKELGLPEHWLESIFPAEQVLLSRSIDKEELQIKIKNKEKIFLEEMIDYLKSIWENGHDDI